MLYSKILVAYEGSNLGEKALSKAIEIAKTNELIEIIVLTVIEFPPASFGIEYIYSDQLEYVKKEGEETIQKLEATLSKIPNHSRSILIEGHVAKSIIRQSKLNKCDLIVMGSRGLSGLKVLFMGSVSQYVVQHSNIPVLIVK